MNIDIYAQIKIKRGASICERKEKGFSSVGAAAASFGLKGDDGCYREIQRYEALRILTAVLWKDMAYGSQIMGYDFAKKLAAAFLAQNTDTSDIYTNSEWSTEEDGEYILSTWSPGTDATFNVGIILLFQNSVACVWVEDED